MKQKHPPAKTLVIGAVLAWILMTAVSCQKKEPKPWQYFGEASSEQTQQAKPAQPTP